MLSLLLHSLWCSITIRGTMCSKGGPDMAAIDSGGGDHVFCHRQSGGTTFRGDQLKYDRSQLSH